MQQNKDKSADQLYEFALQKWKGFPAAYNVTEEKAKEYIAFVKQSYNNLQKWVVKHYNL